MPFELASPSGLLLLLGLGPLVALYVLKIRRTRRVVPSTWLWREARRDLLARKPFRRLLPEVPLLLEALALALLALALARPASKSALSGASHLAVVFDTSASMGAAEGGKTRRDLALLAATDVVRSLPSGADVLVVDGAREPRVVTGLEMDPSRVGKVLEGLSVREEEGDLTHALALSEERLARLPGQSRIVVVTDVNGDVPSGGAVPVDVVRVGTLVDNTAVVRTTMRRATSQATPERVEALVLVRHFGDSRTTRFVTLRRRGDSAELSSRRLDLAPGERAAVVLGFEARPEDVGRGVMVELSPGDALAADDRAYAAIPPGARVPVVLAPPHADPWLERAFAADPEVELFAAELAALEGEGIPRDALVVTKGVCPRAPLRGSLFVVDPPDGPCLGVKVGASVEPVRVTSWADHDPRLRFVGFDDVHLGRARLVEAPRAAALVRADGGPVVVDLDLPGRSGTLAAFDPGAGDFPLRSSFVLFVRNVTDLARAVRARNASGSVRTGEALRMAIPGAADGVVIRGPGGELATRVVEGVAVGAPPTTAGFYDAVDGKGRDLATAAASFESERESNLRGPPAAAPGNAARAGVGLAPAIPSAAWIAAAVALALFSAEVFWLTRRRGERPARARPVALAAYAAAVLVAAAIAVYAILVQTGAVPERWIRFDRPEWTVVGALAAAVAAFRFDRAPVVVGAARRALVEAAFFAALSTSALAAAEPSSSTPLDRVAVVVAVDRSRSTELAGDVEARVEADLVAARSSLRKGDRLGVVAFGDTAVLEEPLRERMEPRTPQRAVVGRDATDLSGAIRRALSECPPDASPKVVLVSDGVATRGDTIAAALGAALAGTPVDVVALEQRPFESVRVESVRGPARADEGENIDLRVTTRATRDQEVDVELSRDGTVIRKGRQRIHAGEDVLFLRDKAEGRGLSRYEVHVAPAEATADALVGDNAGTAFVRVVGASRALVLEGDPGRAAAMIAALRSASFQVDVVGATTAPGSLDELGRYDLVVLSDVPAVDLPPERIDELALSVERLGGGLLLMGGDRSMGPGGYAGTPLEAVSPVSFDLKNERRRARLAEVIVIDYSGSMSAPAGGRTKLALANEAAARSAALLGAVDRLGVTHVDTDVAWTVPLSPLDDAAEVGRRIRAVQPGGGGIFVDLALSAAYAALDRETVELKHVLLFADGSDAEERVRAPELARSALRRGVTTSVVALGRGPDIPDLERLSREGKGRFYLIEDANRLPAVFAQETTLASRSAISEEPFRPRVTSGTAVTRGIDFAGAPALGGYVVTRRKPRAEVALAALEGDPLLATWSAGIGRAGAFTSDYKDRWGAGWTTWPDATRLFAQLARDLSRHVDAAGTSVTAGVTGGTLSVRASALTEDGASDASRRLVANVAGPAGFSLAVPLQPVAPGAYAAELSLSKAGTYLASVTDESTGGMVGTAGALFSPAEELSPTGTDRALLARVAQITGGAVRTDIASALSNRPAPRRVFHPLGPSLAVLAAVFLFAQVGSRRLSIPSLRRRPKTGAGDAELVEGDAPTARPAAAGAERPGPATLEPGEAPDPDGTASVAVAPEEGPPPARPATTAEVLLERRKRRR